LFACEQMLLLVGTGTQVVVVEDEVVVVVGLLPGVVVGLEAPQV